MPSSSAINRKPSGRRAKIFSATSSISATLGASGSYIGRPEPASSSSEAALKVWLAAKRPSSRVVVSGSASSSARVKTTVYPRARARSIKF